MPIKFHCPNASCGRALTVSDEAAGRTGKCPGCGNTLVVPRPKPATDDDVYGLEDEPAAEAEPEPAPRPQARPRPQAARVPVSTAPVKTTRDIDPDWDAVGASGSTGPVISFDAIGLAWDLLKRKMGTWVLAMIAVGLVQWVCQLAVMFVAMLAGTAEIALIGNPLPLSTFLVICFGVMLQMVLFGGLYKMALKQVDGGDIGVGDAFAFDHAPGLAVAGVLTALGTGFGFLFLIVPGLVFTALSMFTIPAVVDGLGGVEAIKRSVGTLTRQWFLAIVFLLVTGMILGAGVFLLGFGVLITAPLYVLTVTVQYRRSFAPGGVPRKAVVADPWAEAVGEPARATGSGRVPVWAWGMLGVGIVMPMVAVAVVGALAVSAARQAAEQMVKREEMRQGPMADGVPDEAKQEAMLRELFQRPGPGRGVPPGMDPTRPLAPARATKDPLRQDGDTRSATAPGRPQVNRNDPGALRTLALADLKSADRGQRERALDGLLGRPPSMMDNHGEVLDAVLPLLQDPEPSIRRRAVSVIATWGTNRERPALVDALSDPDQAVKRTVITVLGRTRDRQTALALARLLMVPDVYRDAANALRVMKLRDKEVEAEVCKALDSDDPSVRAVACMVLEVTGTTASVPALKRAAVDRQRNVASAASQALSAITTPTKSRTLADRFKGKMRNAP